MKTLTIVIGKFVALVGDMLGRGSALPGKIVRDLDPNFLSKIDMPKTIMVTGTNGKTSTSHFINQILAQDYRVIHNAQGANMPQGIASLILRHTDLGGRVDKDLAVLEVDEAFLQTISKDIKADYLVLTNISQDQVDRFTSLKMVEDLILSGISKDMTIIANGNDPSLVKICSGLDNKVIYYGADLEEGRADFACPQCGQDLAYSKGFYGNIGIFSCSCGLTSPTIDYLAEDIDLAEGSFKVGGYKFKSPYHADYMVYNMMAAIALAKDMGIANESIGQALDDFQIGGGRMETIVFGGKETIFNLVKNPAGLSRTLDFISKDGEDYNIYLDINKRPADGEDLSWLEEVDFSMVGPLDLVIEGEASDEAKHILNKKGLRISPKSLEDLKASPHKTYFLSNYTAMGALKAKLEALK